MKVKPFSRCQFNTVIFMSILTGKGGRQKSLKMCGHPLWMAPIVCLIILLNWIPNSLYY